MIFTVSIKGTWSDICINITSIASVSDSYPSSSGTATMADSKDGILSAAASQGAKGVVADDGKWRNGIKNTILDCPVEAAWDLFSDWGRWSWYTPPDTVEHTEGEHRKAGCVRVIRYPTGMWVTERALVIDNEKRFLSFTLEENNAFGGMKGFIAKAEFQGTSDGKTLIPYLGYEMEPLENYTPETFQPVVETIFKPLFHDLEKGAQRLAAAGPEHAVDSSTTETL